MKIIEAKFASTLTDMNRTNSDSYCQIEDFCSNFNAIVRKSAYSGKNMCLISWEQLGIKRPPNEEDFINLATFVGELINNGYSVEYWWKGREHDISGLVVAWGAIADRCVMEFVDMNNQ